MNAKRKSNSVVTHAVVDGVITFSVLGAGEFTLDMARLAPAVAAQAALHGMVQRISDRAAMDRNPDTGRPASPEEKFARMRTLAEHYMAGGEWALRAAGGGGDQGGLTYEAIARVKGCTVDEARVAIARRAETEGLEVRAVLARMRESARVIEAIAAIKAARANPDVDTSLDDLEV